VERAPVVDISADRNRSRGDQCLHRCRTVGSLSGAFHDWEDTANASRRYGSICHDHPDELLQPHMVFHEGSAFAAQHGSWNRNLRTGYKVIRVPFHKDGTAVGSYEDFMTGFITNEGYAWGRPVGVAAGADGSLYVSDDGSNTIWRIRKAAAR